MNSLGHATLGVGWKGEIARKRLIDIATNCKYLFVTEETGRILTDAEKAYALSMMQESGIVKEVLLRIPKGWKLPSS